MDDILKLAKDYSKERHLDLLPRCNNNILDKLDYIYDENWENQGVSYPYEILTYLFDSYYVLPERPDLAALFCWQAINHSYYVQQLSDNNVGFCQDTKGIELIRDAILEQKDFADLYLPMWGNALCADRKELDVLGVGAYDGEKLVGLAACSADCDNMWQIGVDVLPEYRRMGIASSLTSNLAIEIIERGKVPFYCCAWSNLKSVKNALRSGFVPGWVEMTVKAASLVDEMNK